MQLEPEHRRLINIATARARAFGRNQAIHEIEQLQQQIDALRAELAAARHAAELWREWRERCKLVYEELNALREWRAAHIEHEQAKRDLAAARRRHQLEVAWSVKFDPTSTTRH